MSKFKSVRSDGHDCSVVIKMNVFKWANGFSPGKYVEVEILSWDFFLEEKLTPVRK